VIELFWQWLWHIMTTLFSGLYISLRAVNCSRISGKRRYYFRCTRVFLFNPRISGGGRLRKRQFLKVSTQCVIILAWVNNHATHPLAKLSFAVSHFFDLYPWKNGNGIKTGLLPAAKDYIYIAHDLNSIGMWRKTKSRRK
jgi:hypothetical protein